MSARTIRRAAERHALKLAAKANTVTVASASVATPVEIPLTVDFTATSESQILANRANAQFSTGPKTPEGKATSSLNAVKTGLTGRTVLLTSDDALIYQQHLDRNFLEFSPVTDREKSLVQSIADTEWRLLRITPLEASLYAIGRLELSDQFADHSDPINREALILGKIYQTYKKDFNNLALQERRLRAHRKTDLAELQQLQKERSEKETDKQTKAPRANGFEFSNEEMSAFCDANFDQRQLTGLNLDFETFLEERAANSGV
jgi:hypothetical protein